MESLKTIANYLFRQDKENLVQREPHSAKFLRQRRFFMVMPLLVLPFLTLMFWALGGGKANSTGNPTQTHNGLNMQLPDASLKADNPLNKMGYYEKAAADSARLKGLIKNDPYYMQQAGSGFHLNPDSSLHGGSFHDRYPSLGGRLNTSPYGGPDYQDPNEAKVYEKLEQLNLVLSQGSGNPGSAPGQEFAYSSPGSNSLNTADLERLEQMMQATQENEAGDPEMQQLNGMLEKILDIQHPQRVQEKIRQNSKAEKGKVFAVRMKGKDNPVTLLENKESGKRKGKRQPNPANRRNDFYSWQEEQVAANAAPNAIAAVVHETQTIFTGSAVRLRLSHDVSINGVLVPKDSFLFGTASLNGERLNIKITNIRFRNSLFPVELSVYDMDGLAGIYIPGAITRDVARQSADRAVQDIGFSTLDPSLEIQAASAGVEVAKSLFNKKAKLVKVTVKAGYQVLLRDEKQV